jgi:hypothetical protein
MSARIISLAVAFISATALAAAAAAAPPRALAITFAVQNVGDGSSACPPGVFGLSFEMVSPQGAPLGTGVSCIFSADGCDPFVQFVPGCHRSVDVRFELHFADGAVIAPMRLFELYRTPLTFLQVGVGHIAGGTGSFAAARGVVEGGGTATFTETGIDPHLVYTVHAVV